MKLNNNDDSHNSGLNLLIYNMLLDIESHPAWVCGLKHSVFVGWLSVWGHTLRGCVDWNLILPLVLLLFLCHTLRGCVDWNTRGNAITTGLRESHPAWVCGLKPADNLCRHTTRVSHPAWVCGLKLLRADRTHTHVCHTLRGCVDWNSCARLSKLLPVSHPAWVCGLKPERDRVYRYKL